METELTPPVTRQSSPIIEPLSNNAAPQPLIKLFRRAHSIFSVDFAGTSWNHQCQSSSLRKSLESDLRASEGEGPSDIDPVTVNHLILLSDGTNETCCRKRLCVLNTLARLDALPWHLTDYPPAPGKFGRDLLVIIDLISREEGATKENTKQALDTIVRARTGQRRKGAGRGYKSQAILTTADANKALELLRQTESVEARTSRIARRRKPKQPRPVSQSQQEASTPNPQSTAERRSRTPSREAPQSHRSTSHHSEASDQDCSPEVGRHRVDERAEEGADNDTSGVGEGPSTIDSSFGPTRNRVPDDTNDEAEDDFALNLGGNDDDDDEDNEDNDDDDDDDEDDGYEDERHSFTIGCPRHQLILHGLRNKFLQHSSNMNDTTTEQIQSMTSERQRTADAALLQRLSTNDESYREDIIRFYHRMKEYSGNVSQLCEPVRDLERASKAEPQELVDARRERRRLEIQKTSLQQSVEAAQNGQGVRSSNAQDDIAHLQQSILCTQADLDAAILKVQQLTTDHEKQDPLPGLDLWYKRSQQLDDMSELLRALSPGILQSDASRKRQRPEA